MRKIAIIPLFDRSLLLSALAFQYFMCIRIHIACTCIFNISFTLYVMYSRYFMSFEMLTFQSIWHSVLGGLCNRVQRL
jgi:hypothetical protein